MPSVRTQSEDYRMRRTSSQVIRDRESAADYHALENADDASEISDLETRSPKPLCGGRLSYFQLGFIVLTSVGLILLVLYLLTPVFARPIGNQGTVSFTNMHVFDTGSEIQVSADVQLTNTVRVGATVHDAIFRFRSNDKDLGEFPVAQFSFPGRETVEIELNGVVLNIGNSPEFFQSVLTEENVDLQLEASVAMSMGGLILPYNVPFNVRETHRAVNNFNGGVRTSLAFDTDDNNQLMIRMQADFENPSDIELELDAIDLELAASGSVLTTVTLPELRLAPRGDDDDDTVVSSFELSGPIDSTSEGLSKLMAMAFSGSVVNAGSFVGTVQGSTPSSEFLQGVPVDFGALFLKREEVGNGDTDVSVQEVGPMFTGAAFRVRPIDMIDGVPEQVDFGLQIFNPFNSPVTIETVSFDISIGDKPENTGDPLEDSEDLGTFAVRTPFDMTASSVEAGQTFVSGTLQLADTSLTTKCHVEVKVVLPGQIFMGGTPQLADSTNDRLDRLLNDRESFGMAISGSMTVSINDVSTDIDIDVTMPTFSCADADSVADAGEIGGEFLGLAGVDAFCVAEVPTVSIEGTCEFVNITMDDVNGEICQDEHDQCLLSPGCRHMVEDVSAQCDFPNDALPGPLHCWLNKNGMATGTDAFMRYALMVECVQQVCQDPTLAVLLEPVTDAPTAAPTPVPTVEPCPLTESDVRDTCADEFTACEADNPCRTVVSREEICEIPEQMLDGGNFCFLRAGLNFGSSSFPLLQDVAQCVIDACEAAEAAA